jgi:hypothetical protein
MDPDSDREKGRRQQVRERRTEQEQEWVSRPDEQQPRAGPAPRRAKRERQVPPERRASADVFAELERRHGLDVRSDLSAEERVARVLARMDDERAG